MRAAAPIRLIVAVSLAALPAGPARAQLWWPWNGGAGAERAAPKPPRSGPRDSRETFPDIGYADWSDREPDYRFYPGDQIDITVPSAPELSKQGIVVQPDGRIAMPLIAPLMAADLTVPELEAALTRAYAGQLLRPQVQVTVKSTTPLKVMVGGEVGNPGVYDMPGDINSLQAIIQAGGFKVGARTDQVVILRRGPGGKVLSRTVNLKGALKGRPGADLAPLRRFDIVYVPRSSVAEAGLFVQQWFRDLSPINFGFSYAINGQNP
ncbi:MAG: polysaccharide biosynthesis/export family protein [Pseudomonadota bacterium]